ncbi:hypothetical protein Q8F55_003476 [Vanrija albida]|uniref:EF-hand domain-containing protein n=1 Tax=Vanrija albida TaxID=181172 RepID=A0ABR3Q412_9TREE
MPRLTAAAVLLLASVALAHGGHAEGDDEGLSYAESHMHNEHHIDSFDPPAFFKLHDLDSDGFWSADEIAALYGLRHHSVLDPHRASTVPDGLETRVVAEVLGKLDTDGDDHHKLEEEEDARQRIFQGLAPDADLEEDHEVVDPLDVHEHAAGEGVGGDGFTGDEEVPLVSGVDGGNEEPVVSEGGAEGAAAGQEGAAAGQEGAAAGQEDAAQEDKEDAPVYEEAPTEAAAADAAHITITPDDPGFRAARAAARTPPRRINPEGSNANRRGHTPEHRLKADTPYKFKMRAGIRGDEF